MKKITEVSQGSGYRDLRLDDNSVQRVQDDDLPSGYEPAIGDAIEIAEDGSIVVGAGTVEGAAGADSEAGHE